MPARDADPAEDVDFVVGSDAGGSGETIRHKSAEHPRRWQNLRLRLTLAGGAAILALGTIIARASAGHHALDKASHPPTPTTSTRSVQTSPKVSAAIHAAFEDSDVVSAQTLLVFRPGHVDPSLLSRTVTARIPIGTIRITIARAATGANPDSVTRRSDQQMTTFVAVARFHGYSVTATLAQNAMRSDPTALLERLANDTRLLSIR